MFNYPIYQLQSDGAWNEIGSSALWDHDGRWAVMQERLPQRGGDLADIVSSCMSVDRDGE